MDTSRFLKKLQRVHEKLEESAQFSFVQARFTNEDLEALRQAVLQIQNTLEAVRLRLSLANLAELSYEHAIPDDEMAYLLLSAIRIKNDDNAALARSPGDRRRVRQLMEALKAISIDRHFVRREA